MNFNIKPLIPEIKGISGSLTVTLIAGGLFLIAVILISVCIGKFAANKWNGSKGKVTAGFILISSAVAIALFCFFGLSARTIQGIIFSLILLVSSYSDIKTRECDDCLSVMILITAFIGINISSLPSMIVSALFTLGMFLLVVLLISDNIGGADIKICAASTFLLGFSRGVIGLAVGLLFAVIVNSLKNRKSGFPMIPYLTAAFIPAFFL